MCVLCGVTSVLGMCVCVCAHMCVHAANCYKHTITDASDAHFHQSPVIDQLKSQKTNCSIPHQDLGLIEMKGLVVSWPVVFMVPQTSLLLFYHRIQASGQHKRQRCRQVQPDRWGTMFWLK